MILDSAKFLPVCDECKGEAAIGNELLTCPSCYGKTHEECSTTCAICFHKVCCDCYERLDGEYICLDCKDEHFDSKGNRLPKHEDYPFVTTGQR